MNYECKAGDTMKTKRRYVYDETYTKVMDWVEKRKQMGLINPQPNGKVNFPFCLKEYIKHLKEKAKK